MYLKGRYRAPLKRLGFLLGWYKAGLELNLEAHGT